MLSISFSRRSFTSRQLATRSIVPYQIGPYSITATHLTDTPRRSSPALLLYNYPSLGITLQIRRFDRGKSAIPDLSCWHYSNLLSQLSQESYRLGLSKDRPTVSVAVVSSYRSLLLWRSDAPVPVI